MSALPLCLLVFAAVPQAPESAKTTSDAVPKQPSEVVVLGMIHGGHRSSEKWGLDELRETIRRIKPDVVLCEIPPDRWPAALEVWRERQVIEDDRIRRFPEYIDVLIPLMDEMKFTIEPCAAWTTEMANARAQVISKFNQHEGGADANTQDLRDYQKAEAWVEKWAATHTLDSNDPLVIHSRHYDHYTKGSLLPYDHWLNDRIGGGGWTGINQAHYALIDAALKRHQGKRILITFGAGHKYWFLEQLRWRTDIKLLDPRPFLPGGDVPRSEHDQVIEEVYAFAEVVWRCFYDKEMTFMRPAMQRIDQSMSPKDSMQFINGLRRGGHGSTFLNQEWIGPVTAEQDEQGAWQVQFSIHWALGDLSDKRRVTATLMEDDTTAGGFRWSAVNWPR